MNIDQQRASSKPADVRAACLACSDSRNGHTMLMRPIPAFYCCYLLRSRDHPAARYIGSTPNPVRRLAQHNGDSKGGAFRTARNNLRPWDMICMVTGFPSMIAALQFEWAWDHPHITKKIPDKDRITFPDYKVKTVRRTGQKRNKPVCPPMSLSDHLSNLHLMLRVSAFRRWPLAVNFFFEDVYDTWQSCHGKADAIIQSRINIMFDVNQAVDVSQPANLSISSDVNGKGKREAVGQGGIRGIDVGYTYLEGPIEKSTFLLADSETINCSVCAKALGLERMLSLICPAEGCKAASHLSCLGDKFLHDEGVSDSIVPTSGKCPQCKTETPWVDLVKEMSLRIRGKKELAVLTKKRRGRKAKAPKLAKAGVSKTEVSESEDATDIDTDSGSLGAALLAADDEDDLLQDNWRFQEDDDDDDLTSVTSAASGFSDGIDMPSPGKTSGAAPRLKTVIEDSEWDDVEVLD